MASYNVATCFDQLYGHPEATCAHKTKITIANFVLGHNIISVRSTMHIHKTLFTSYTCIVLQTEISDWPNMKFEILILVLRQVAWGLPYNWSKHVDTFYDVIRLVVSVTYIISFMTLTNTTECLKFKRKKKNAIVQYGVHENPKFQNLST
jgi:hypothetical protein